MIDVQAPGPRTTPAPLVLVVDDHEDSREVMVIMLEAGHFRATSASGALQAFERIADETPAVIITDIAMPGLDGWTLIERLKADEVTRGIPVIVLTGYASDASKVQALAKGSTFFAKPFEPSELLAEVTYLVYGESSRNRRQRERSS